MDQLTENTTALGKQQEYINRMQLFLEDIDNIANDSIGELVRQHDQIETQKEKIVEIGDKVQGARTIISRMTQKQVVQSIVLCLFIFLLMFAIGAIALSSTLSRSGSGSSSR